MAKAVGCGSCKAVWGWVVVVVVVDEGEGEERRNRGEVREEVR